MQDMLASDSAKPQMYSAMALLRHARRERDAAIEKYVNVIYCCCRVIVAVAAAVVDVVV